MSAVRLYRGTLFRRRLSAEATGGAVAPVWATTSATFVLDGPNKQRIEFAWRPGGASSPQIIHDAVGNTLDLNLTPPWTAANLTIGQWQLDLLNRDPAIDQWWVGKLLINVSDLRNGSAPVGG